MAAVGASAIHIKQPFVDAALVELVPARQRSHHIARIKQ
jgi:hypothetical protein